MEVGQESPIVSVIIVNWNRSNDVLEAIRVLSQTPWDKAEIIVVDNGSTDGSTERLAAQESIRLVRSEKNIGPAAARNLAIDAVRGRYIFFLDSDATVTTEDLKRLVGRMDEDPTIGIIGCRIIHGKTREIDQWIYAQNQGAYANQEFDTYSFSAAGAIVRVEALAKAGRFWDDLFIYNEETDLSIRVLKAGYRILYSPIVDVLHNPAETGRVIPARYWFYQVRNQIWIFFRYYPFPHRWLNTAKYAGVYIIKSAANRQLKSGLSGIASGLGGRRIIRDFREKLSFEECRRIGALNRRYSLRLGR